jgi:Ca-activated chloride channel family protein
MQTRTAAAGSSTSGGSGPVGGGPVGGGRASGGQASGGQASAPAAAGGSAAVPSRIPGSASVDPRVDPLSTFALDVDTASYGYAKRTLVDGVLPDPTTVRAEEFVNAFAQDYPQPAGNGFTVTADGAILGGTATGGTHRVLRIGLQTRAADATERPDAALTFVIDVSGSMGDEGKLSLVQQSLHTLVAALRPSDSIGIVTFSAEATVVRPLRRIDDRASVDAAIDALRVEGSTNLQAGLESGYRVARTGYQAGRTNRVILLSDGLANTGDTDANSLVDRVREAAGNGIALLGVGVGSDYGDKLMETLADHGNGFTSYVSDVAAARALFVDKLPTTLAVRAQDAKAQVSFDARTVASYRLIGYDDRAVADNNFRNDTVDGGEVGPGHSVTALYDVWLRPGAEGHVGDAQAHWVDPTTRAPHDMSTGIDTSSLDRPLSQAAPRLVVDVTAASLALTLRDATAPYADSAVAGSVDAGTGGSLTGGWPALTALEQPLAAAARRLGDVDVDQLQSLVRLVQERWVPAASGAGSPVPEG